ncbi:aminotransferase class I/II-fold pyridoxal phosphate-dependent enzyme [uncultured Herbaspirillum sp.]|uniref:aminotransferase class I/II-fold pyridoxal phosphate-dependent enzyme n=1 Tax=uncultured Herbaspirillum sp. TaxID=160236 RepID=UPI002584BC1F|nr:aminotransferase class I/II-fold pyridoxal phosphate-dependent enzyme [uncultured Herbaspirillum sp.]
MNEREKSQDGNRLLGTPAPFPYATLPRSEQMENREPLFLTSSFVAESAEHAALLMSDKIPGNVYTRYTNPTVRSFEMKLAQLEGAQDAVAASSGMAAIMNTLFALLKSGDHILCSASVFGSVRGLIENYLNKFGVTHSYVYSTDPTDWGREMRDNTRLLFLETPSNPLCEIFCIRQISDLARQADALLVVDNTVATAALQHPLAIGADLVVHSATKYIDGQGRTLGGVVAGRADLVAEIKKFVRSGGACLSPFNAWMLSSGMETLNIRMEAHSARAMKIAEYLCDAPKVARVFYPGLRSHHGHDVASLQQSGFGGMLSFYVDAPKEKVWSFINALSTITKTANIGDARSTVTHPQSTTHNRVPVQEQLRTGITEQLVRLSVGLEPADDLLNDIDNALRQI